MAKINPLFEKLLSWAGHDPTGRYILDAEGNPVPEPDLLKWGRWIEMAERRVALTKVAKDVEVSTVFLGLDYNVSREEASVGHECMVHQVATAEDAIDAISPLTV